MIRSSIKNDSTSTSTYQLPIAFQCVLASGYYLLCLYWNLGQFGILCKFTAASSHSWVFPLFNIVCLILWGFICLLLFAIFDQMESCSEILFLDLYLEDKSYGFPELIWHFHFHIEFHVVLIFYRAHLNRKKKKKNIRRRDHEFKTSLGYHLVTQEYCKHRQKDY